MPPPCARGAVVDRYFLEHRAKVLEVAAFLDRVERATPDVDHAGGEEGGDEGGEDVRVAALRRCIAVLLDGQPERARRVLETLSDQTLEPVQVAPGKGASGVPSVDQTLRSPPLPTRSASA